MIFLFNRPYYDKILYNKNKKIMKILSRSLCRIYASELKIIWHAYVQISMIKNPALEDAQAPIYSFSQLLFIFIDTSCHTFNFSKLLKE